MKKLTILPIMASLILVSSVCQTEASAQQANAATKNYPLREAWYGDLHLHTSYSFDAYLGGTLAITPDDAYRFARGEVVDYLGQPVQRDRALDFLAVTDHSENIGIFNALEDPDSPISKSEAGRFFKAFQTKYANRDARNDSADSADRKSLSQHFAELWSDYFLGLHNKLPEEFRSGSSSAWSRVIDFANRNYQPGKFTTFIAYEWTAMAHGANLHRNVIFKGDTAPYPFTSLDSKYPEDLWAWLEDIRSQGVEALAIPHNSNASNGLMYDWVKSDSLAITRAYAEARQANEPLNEITQIKGASETHPLLSPNDEFADYEIFDWVTGWRRQDGRVQGSYLRDGLSRGLVLEREVGANPYKTGFAGASDLHGGLSVSAQADFNGSHADIDRGAGRLSKERAAQVLGGDGWGAKLTSGGLTGAWAESNTRESIYSAFRRRETFATSGTRLKFRFFGGWRFDERLLQQKDWIARAYADGVPMGGDLPAKPAAAERPEFLIWAVKDPDGANLDRVQVIKIWEEDGKQMEKIFDVVWSGERRPDPETGKLPAVGDTVDLKTGDFSNMIGATELKAVWKDPDFNPRQMAAYYLRVLEIPTPRWSTLLAIRNDLPLPKGVPATIQQRGWSSPIWLNGSEK